MDKINSLEKEWKSFRNIALTIIGLIVSVLVGPSIIVYFNMSSTVEELRQVRLDHEIEIHNLKSEREKLKANLDTQSNLVHSLSEIRKKTEELEGRIEKNELEFRSNKKESIPVN